MSQTHFKRQRCLIKKYVKESQNLKKQQTRNYDEYIAKHILEDIRHRKSIEMIKNCYLNKLEIMNLTNIHPLFNNYLDQAIKEVLFQIILLSRLSKDIDLASSNATSILAKSDFSFKDLNLSHVRIPKADLSQCLLINVNFENSYLKEVQFLQSHLVNVNFKNCDLSNTKFGIFMKIDLQDATALSFSPDDKHFYYRAGENLMKMNLDNQEMKHKGRLINFVSSHIISIYHTDLRSYKASVWGKNMEIWDQYQKQLIFVINTAKVVFSPNWKYIAALDKKLSVLCWDIEKNKQTLGGDKIYSCKASQLIFSPCSKYLAIVKAHVIYIIKTENWSLEKSIYGNFAVKKTFALSYSATKMAYGYSRLLELIDTKTSDKAKIYLTYKKVRGMSFSPCGRFLAIASNERTGYIVDLNSQKIVHIFNGFESNVISVLFSPSNKYISWSDSSNNIRIYEFFPNFLKNDYNRHYQIQTAKVSPKGTYLLTWSLQKTILWDLTSSTPKQIKQLTDHYYFGEFVFSPFETYLAKAIFEVIYIYDIKSDRFIKHRIEKYNWRYFSFSENEDYIISLNESSYEYYKLPSFEIVRKFNTQDKTLNSYKFTSCGRYHLHSNKNRLFIWNLNKNDFIMSWNKYYLYTEFNFAPVSKQIACIDLKEKTGIRILKASADENKWLKAAGEIPVYHCFSSDEKLLIGGYKCGVINIWDIKTQTIQQKIKSLAFRDINWIEAVNDHIFIREKDNIEIFKLNQLS